MTESSTNHFHPDIEQNTMYEERLKTKHIRSMPVGNERLAALRDLGATFTEGNHQTAKIATPSGTPKIPTFVDVGQIEFLLQQKKRIAYPTMTAGREDLGRYNDLR
ncbi:hypothetical protein EDC96DRAFT_515374 [Choanephora cucurbitarum]|nr:hypothetical protein EDC96DRAFT_515374 [Choanephora cucurbitarum]